MIDETVFEATRACPAAISSACAAIKTGLNIDWTTVTWLDLRKPLYSGAAAALNTLMQLSGQGMPGDIDEQAKVWATMYGEQADTFSSIASQAITLDCTQKMDLVLILDSSRSVSPSDFNLMLKFAADVVDVIDVSSDVVRVADVVYSGTVRVEFDFNDYTGKDDLKNKILATYKTLRSNSTEHVRCIVGTSYYRLAEANVTCGILDVYVSTTDPKPNPAVYENKYQATDGSPAVLTVTEFLSKGTPVYITVVGTRLPDSAAQLKGCTDYTWSLEVTPVKGE
nr:hypothetical protein BaRGS_027446 [Batillaria attramentaria]